MGRGRKRTTHCPRCGAEKTAENTYRRASGLFMDVCKVCSSEITMARYRSKLSDGKLEALLEQHEEAVKKIKEELRRRVEVA